MQEAFLISRRGWGQVGWGRAKAVPTTRKRGRFTGGAGISLFLVCTLQNASTAESIWTKLAGWFPKIQGLYNFNSFSNVSSRLIMFTGSMPVLTILFWFQNVGCKKHIIHTRPSGANRQRLDFVIRGTRGEKWSTSFSFFNEVCVNFYLITERRH